MKKFIDTVTLPYFIYVMYFLGVGFLGGAIVHFPVNPSLYGTIGVVGALIFTVASTLNEWITNKRHLFHQGVLKVTLYSLILSIGLGMMSGGIQHFVDFPIYASYLIPGGFLISLVGYVLSKEIKLDAKHKLLLMGKMALIAIPLFIFLNSWAAMMDSSAGHGHDTTDAASDKKMDHMMKVANDEEFITQMIPHHEEAITTSQLILDNTQNQELQKFAQAVIEAQSSEVTQMKDWHLAWFGKEYIENTEYMPMMGNLLFYTDEDLDVAYIEGMIVHHNGAIDMANQILPITSKPEIKKMAQDIITVQTREVEMLQQMATQYEHTDPEHTKH